MTLRAPRYETMADRRVVAALAVYWCLIFALTHLPFRSITLPGQSDKFVHLLMYLGLAFLLMFGGVGLLVSFILVEDPEMRKLWSMGLIPMMTGFGLFLFWGLTTIMLKKKDD